MPQSVVQTSADNSGNNIPLAAGGNEFTDGDGVTRFHSYNVTPKREQSGPQTQNGLAANTLSNDIVPTSATPSTLFIQVSAAGTVTIYLTSHGGGAHYQLYDEQGSAVSIAMAANQAICIQIPPCNAVAIQNTVSCNVTLEICGVVAG